MLRPQFVKLQPHHMQELRHWAIELVVVVVGVLFALWAAEWAEGRREDQRLADLELAMRDELSENYIHAVMDGGSDPCKLRDLADLRQRLLANEGPWEGVDTRYVARLEGDDEFQLGLFAVHPTLYLLGSWETTQQSGLIARMPGQKLDLYRSAFGASVRLFEARQELEDQRDALASVIFPGELSPDMRSEALRNITIATLALGRRTHHEDLARLLNELDITLSVEQAEYLAHADQQMSQLLGSCFKLPDVIVPTESRPG